MFHKENSSTSSSKGKKAKDVPLRKSDRRALRQRVTQVLWTVVDRDNHDNDNDDDKNADDSTFTRTRTHTCIDSSALLDDIFLQGTLMSRQIQLPDRNIKATLYIRSPSSKQDNNDDSSMSSSSSSMSCWPFTVSAQCVWMQLDSKSHWPAADDGTAILVDVPTLPLLAVLSSQHNKLLRVEQHQQQPTVAAIIPTITVPPVCSKYLCRGAHLMRAGMRQWLVPSSPPSSSSSKNHPSNRQQRQGPKVVAVQVQGNPQPFAVGILADDLDWKDDTSNQNHKIGVGTTGVGVTIVTCYGDDLWKQQQQVSTTMATTTKTTSIFDDGDYGNAGFCQGKYVVPLVDTGDNNVNDANNESDSEKDADNNTNNKCNQEAQAVQPNDEPNQEKEEEDNINHVSMEGVYAAVSADDTLTPALIVEDNTSPLPDNDNEIIIAVDATTLEPQQQQQQQQAEEELDQSLTPDQVLHAAVCRALVQINPKKQLPMLVSTFYSQHVLPNRPPGTTIELKRTKYKKLGPYLAEQVETGLLTVKAADNNKTNNNPIAFLTDYNKRHPDLQEYAAQEKAAASTLTGSSSSEERLVMTNLYCLPAHFASLLRLDPVVVKAENATSPERKGTGMLTVKEMRSILEEYIDREGLVDSLQPQVVVLDGPLTDALYGKKMKMKRADPQQKVTAIPDRLSRKDLMELWTNKMEGAFAIVQLPSNRIVKMGRGKPPNVTVEVSMRQSRKFVTHVRGLEHFGLDATAVCKDVSQRFACSGSVEENPTNRAALPTGHVELVFQGNLADELEALLIGDESLSSHGGVRRSPYRLPKNSMEFVLRKGVPPRKKKVTTKKRK